MYKKKMISFLKHWKQKRTWQAEEKAEKRYLLRLRRTRMLAAIAEMTEEERKSYYHDRAMAHMYAHGRGILSPNRYRQKQTSFELLGFVIGLFSTTVSARFFGFVWGDGWRSYGILALAGVAGVACALISEQIFIANFVSDASLDDPLFTPAWVKDMSRWEGDY